MKKTILITAFASSLLSYGVDVKSGWNLVGFPVDLSSEKASSIELINRHYTFKSGSWILNGDIEKVDGVWIKSLRDGTIYVEEEELFVEDISKIELESGWNLVSLPVNSAVSPDIFRDQTSVWKYSNGEWSKYRKDSLFNDYPTIDVLGAGEGFWVYSENPEVIDIAERSSQLRNFSSDEAMNDYLTSMVRYNKNYQGVYSYYRSGIYYDGTMPTDAVMDEGADLAETSGSTENVSDATTTNLQEIGVDEADIVKHDGTNIFYLSESWNDNKILVTTFQNILNNNLEPITSIDTNTTPDELYLIDNKLIAIYPHNRTFWGYWCSVDYSVWSSKSHIDIYDVSDIHNISKVDSFEFDGNIVDSRVTGGKLYLVSRYMPYIEVEYPKVYVSCESDRYGYCWYEKDEVGYFDYNWSNPIEKELHITPTMNNESLISHTTLYAPSKVDQSPFITSIISFEISDFSKNEVVSVVGGSETIYASTDAIYSVSSSYPRYYDWNRWEEREAIYKFSIDGNLTYSGMGFVDGHILNQFSLSEYRDTLRVATTKGWSWWNGEDTDNIVSALQDINGTLTVVDEIRGLGKEGETIRGVRFLGDKGYVVTFRQTDPLYIIDMSDPKNMKKGENPLEIDGYSTYFHPVNSELLLSLGVNADSDGRTDGYQLQLFNVSDFNNPALVDKVILTGGSSWSLYSEAINDHKAFTYRSSDNLFGLPIREYIRRELTDDEKVEYLKDNYIPIDEVNLTEYGIEDGKITEEELAQDGDYELYAHRYALENGYVAATAISAIPYPSYVYENTLKIYGVDTNSSTINFKSDIIGDSEDRYNYQRGIIFSTGDDESKRDWGLYILGGNLAIGEIEE